MARRSTRNRIREYATAALLSLTLVWLVFLVFGIARKEEIARQAVKDTKAELAELQEREGILQGNLEELATPRGQEAVLRQSYGVAKPGEEVIIVVPPKETPPPPPLPWWKKVLQTVGF